MFKTLSFPERIWIYIKPYFKTYQKRLSFFPVIFFLPLALSSQTTGCHLNIDSVNVNGQTYINPDTIDLCQSDYLFLYSSFYCIDTLFYSNFNGVNPGAGWYSNCSPMLTNPCGPGIDGSTYAWVGPASSFPRELACGPVTLNGVTEIEFDMKYASQANSSPCEGPDLPTEGVHLQGSTDGTNWYEIQYWDPVGGYDPFLTSWQNYCCTVNYSGIVAIRWFQTNTSGNDYDHWGIDNVIIRSISTLPSTIEWDDGNGVFSNNNNIIVNPTQTTTYIVTLLIDSTTTHDSVFINILDSNMSILGLDSIYFTNNPPDIITGYPQPGYFTGPGIFSPNIFSPQHAGAGVHDITWHHYVIGSNTFQVSDIAFSDDFSTDKGWSGYGAGGWERDTATASAGCSGGQDPSSDHTTTADDFIIGNYIGACYPNSMAQTYWLASPVIDCSNSSGCSLEFWSLSGCESSSYDHMYIEAFDGSTWFNLYNNAASFTESIWTLRSYALPQATNNPDFQLRFGMGTTDGSVTYQGWNIDDLAINCNWTVQVNDTLCELSYTQQVTVLLPTGEESDKELSDIKVFPNPAGDVLYIQSENPLFCPVTLTDITGKVMLIQNASGERTKISLEGIAAGTYLLEISDKRYCVVKN